VSVRTEPSRTESRFIVSSFLVRWGTNPPG
jgi:hypothetical protein